MPPRKIMPGMSPGASERENMMRWKRKRKIEIERERARERKKNREGRVDSKERR